MMMIVLRASLHIEHINRVAVAEGEVKKYKERNGGQDPGVHHYTHTTHDGCLHTVDRQERERD